MKLKTIEPDEWVAPPEFYRLRDEAEQTWLRRARTAGLIENRSSTTIGIFLYITENAATIAFPTLDGTFDHLGFTSNDQQALTWCKDLFDYYWDNAQPLVDWRHAPRTKDPR